MTIEKYIGKIINADCMNILKELPDKCIDLVLTDPPYNASNSNIGLKDGYKTINEEWDKNFNPIPYLNECKRVLKDGGSMLFFCSYHLLGDYLKWGGFKNTADYTLGAYNRITRNSKSLYPSC